MNSTTQKALQVLIDDWDGLFPVNPVAIAKKAGINVKAVRDLGYSGKAFIKDGVPVIEYNDSDSDLRKRFTVAHELGHHLLNHTDSGHQFRDDPKAFSINVPSSTEVEANKFAAELLMPEVAVKHFVFKEGITSLPELAERFAVSTVAMQFRLKNLGLL